MIPTEHLCDIDESLEAIAFSFIFRLAPGMDERQTLIYLRDGEGMVQRALMIDPECWSRRPDEAWGA